MSTYPLTLHLTKAEKKRIDREAAALGVSASDYVRKAVDLLDADDIRAIEEVRPLLPEFNAALTRIHDSLAAAADRSERHRQEMERMRTPEYREEVRRSIEKELAGLDAAASLFGVPPATASDEMAPVDGRAEERTSKTHSARTGMREDRDAWRGEDSEQGKKPSK